MADPEQKRKEEFLKSQEAFRENAFIIIKKMDDWSNMTPRSKHLVDEILHSIFFLGKINLVPFSPEDIFCDRDILDALKEKYSRPFQFYDKQLPRRSPFSCVLDMIVLQKKTENEEEIKKSLRDLIKDLKDGILASSTICISQKSKADQSSARYYGVSMSKTCHRITRKLLIPASCLSKWDEYVAGAVMTYCPHDIKKNYFDGTIEVPENIRCEAFSLTDDYIKMDPCRSCHNLFGLNTEETKEWPYGNCAEPESLSNLLKSEEVVKNHTRVHQNAPENWQKAKTEVLKELTNMLKVKNFKWTGDFYEPF
ncbi:uncharacterized protein LOC115788199 [Archocentrus centrarchus]|uniref:uncharacterized protein LOC115788199 n=1 Tax=Archocentrus centrarchus TaxID=63155 RepID=UPI0011E9F19B|nr:uncharacterized protein LOC115788199 [Archocentrus centrarchus]